KTTGRPRSIVASISPPAELPRRERGLPRRRLWAQSQSGLVGIRRRGRTREGDRERRLHAPPAARFHRYLAKPAFNRDHRLCKGLPVAWLLAGPVPEPVLLPSRPCYPPRKGLRPRNCSFGADSDGVYSPGSFLARRARWRSKSMVSGIQPSD